MNKFRTIMLVAEIVLLSHVLPAQTFSNVNSNETPYQSTSPDSIVSVVADQQGLQLLTPDQIPMSGTFWVVNPGSPECGNTPPYPCPPFGIFQPTYEIANGQYLVDNTGTSQPTSNSSLGNQQEAATIGSAADSTETQINTLSDFIAQIKNSGVNHPTVSMDMSVPLPGYGGDGSGGSPMVGNSYSIDTNGLWLEITNVLNGISFLNLHNGTNKIYAIWSTTNLMTTWQIEMEVWPTNGTLIPTVMPFSVQNFSRQNLFLRAEDWTTVTHNGNTTPDWWFWEYFGTTALADTNLDSEGNTMLYDYEFGLDPNTINFTLTVTNNNVNNEISPLQLNVTGGEPSYFAVLVDNTNFTDAIWQPYPSSTIVANLGLNAGWHDVWVGLRGLPSNAMQTWQWERLNLVTLPLLVITNPIGNVVSQPMIQIYGYCQDSLASINYDLSNAFGLFTNQPSEIIDQFYDPTVCGFTTNSFECLDVSLANGLNTITMHAIDLAGGIITTNFNITLDYTAKTNPPLVQILWPTNGTQISGSNFTCSGWISDPTATVITQLVFTSGNTNAFVGGIYTNVYTAQVERNGNFWLENLPINAGSNAFTIIITDVVGNTTATNINIIQSALGLSIDAVTPDSQLWQPTINLTGTISDATYAIWVNGVKGQNNGNGTWLANNVPVNSGGTASFTATAYGPGEQQPDGSYAN